jgi:hypothetical protein
MEATRGFRFDYAAPNAYPAVKLVESVSTVPSSNVTVTVMEYVPGDETLPEVENPLVW